MACSCIWPNDNALNHPNPFLEQSALSVKNQVVVPLNPKRYALIDCVSLLDLHAGALGANRSRSLVIGVNIRCFLLFSYRKTGCASVIRPRVTCPQCLQISPPGRKTGIS